MKAMYRRVSALILLAVAPCLGGCYSHAPIDRGVVAQPATPPATLQKPYDAEAGYALVAIVYPARFDTKGRSWEEIRRLYYGDAFWSSSAAAYAESAESVRESLIQQTVRSTFYAQQLAEELRRRLPQASVVLVPETFTLEPGDNGYADYHTAAELAPPPHVLRVELHASYGKSTPTVAILAPFWGTVGNSLSASVAISSARDDERQRWLTEARKHKRLNASSSPVEGYPPYVANPLAPQVLSLFKSNHAVLTPVGVTFVSNKYGGHSGWVAPADQVRAADPGVRPFAPVFAMLTDLCIELLNATDWSRAPTADLDTYKGALAEAAGVAPEALRIEAQTLRRLVAIERRFLEMQDEQMADVILRGPFSEAMRGVRAAELDILDHVDGARVRQNAATRAANLRGLAMLSSVAASSAAALEAGVPVDPSVSLGVMAWRDVEAAADAHRTATESAAVTDLRRSWDRHLSRTFESQEEVHLATADSEIRIRGNSIGALRRALVNALQPGNE